MKEREDQLASPTLAELYYKQGDIKRAIYVLKNVLSNNPGNLKARLLLQEWEKQFFRNATFEERKAKAERLGQIMEIIRKEKRR